MKEAEDGARFVQWTNVLRRPQRSEDLNHGFKLYVGIKKEFLTKTENLKNEGSGRWGQVRPVDECPAPTVAERRPEPWV